MNTNNYEWLFLILIFNDESTTDISSRVSIEAEKDFIIESVEKTGYKTSGTSVVIVETKRNAFKKETFTTSFKTKQNSGKLESFSEDIISTEAMLTEDSLTQILKNVIKFYNGKNKIILTLGHGSVFGINYTLVEPIKKYLWEFAEKQSLHDSPIWLKKILDHIDKSFTKKDISNYYEPISPSKGFYMLSPREINNAFLSVFDKKGVDILAFSNCFMQNIFAQFDLHKAVNYLVAPISGISYPGYNIEAILLKLDTSSSVAAMAKYFVTPEIIRSNSRYAEVFAKEAIENRWFIQSLQLNSDTYCKLKTSFTNLLNHIHTLLLHSEFTNIVKTLISAIIEDIYKYSKKSMPTLDLFDFCVYCKSLKIKIKINYSNKQQFTSLINTLDELTGLLESIKAEHFIGNSFLNDISNFLDYKVYGSIEKVAERIAYGFYIPDKYISSVTLQRILNEHNTNRPSILDNTKYVDILKLLF